MGQRQGFTARAEVLAAQRQQPLVVAQIDIGVGQILDHQKLRRVHFGPGCQRAGIGGADLRPLAAIGVDQPGKAKVARPDIGQSAAVGPLCHQLRIG